jgi:tetrapyrrole methylase family protein/MazG family protein
MNKENDGNKQFTLENFQAIIRTLRSEHGCPWDKAQTHGSLTGCMLEEAAEAVSGMKLYEKTGNANSMKEELGDVLMQVVLHAQIAEEEGLFTMEDVIAGISEKMIRRHPHVFEADGTPLNGRNPAPDTVRPWQKIKESEKQQKDYKESSVRKHIIKAFTKFYKRIL